jgi:hypothetical protein
MCLGGREGEGRGEGDRRKEGKEQRGERGRRKGREGREGRGEEFLRMNI